MALLIYSQNIVKVKCFALFVCVACLDLEARGQSVLESTNSLALPYDGASKATLKGRSCIAYINKANRRDQSKVNKVSDLSSINIFFGNEYAMKNNASR